jgi:hypothetical protein
MDPNGVFGVDALAGLMPTKATTWEQAGYQWPRNSLAEGVRLVLSARYPISQRLAGLRHGTSRPVDDIDGHWTLIRSILRNPRPDALRLCIIVVITLPWSCNLAFKHEMHLSRTCLAGICRRISRPSSCSGSGTYLISDRSSCQPDSSTSISRVHLSFGCEYHSQAFLAMCSERRSATVRKFAWEACPKTCARVQHHGKPFLPPSAGRRARLCRARCSRTAPSSFAPPW